MPSPRWEWSAESCFVGVLPWAYGELMEVSFGKIGHYVETIKATFQTGQATSFGCAAPV